MIESTAQEFLPKKLVINLAGLWLALISMGIDFGLLMKANLGIGVVILICFLLVALGFGIHFTRGLLDLFRSQHGNRATDGTPEIV